MDLLAEYRDPVGRFAFHTTVRENPGAIREEGVRADAEPNPDSGAILRTIVDLENDVSLPSTGPTRRTATSTPKTSKRR